MSEDEKEEAGDLPRLDNPREAYLSKFEDMKMDRIILEYPPEKQPERKPLTIEEIKRDAIRRDEIINKALESLKPKGPRMRSPITPEERLKHPFKFEDIEWKPQKIGMTGDKPWALLVAYISARAVQDRLDEVFGLMGWRVEYKHLTKGIMAGISCRSQYGEWITKWDGAEPTEYEPFKGGISGALKRCASLWGIGRYLYDLPTTFAQTKTSLDDKDNRTDWARAETKDKKNFFWKYPTREEMKQRSPLALPDDENHTAPAIVSPRR